MAGKYYLLRVFTFGLIAYVTSDSKKPVDLSLLLVDARHPPVASDGCPNNRHIPLLLHEARSEGCASWCHLELGLCQCPLDRVRLEFPALAEPATDPMSCDHLANAVPKLKPVIGSVRKVNPECLFTSTENSVCPFVAAQVDNILPRAAFACKMAVGSYSSNHSSHTPIQEMPYRRFKFRPLSQDNWSMRPAQEVATQIVLVRKMDEPSIKIRLTSYEGTETQELILKADKCPPFPKLSSASSLQAVSTSFEASVKGALPEGCIDVVIGNIPVHSEHHHLYGRCRGHGIDRDFELFEDLALNQVELEDRPVPFDRPEVASTPEELKGYYRSPLCDGNLLQAFERWLRTDQATSECSGGGLGKPKP